MKFVLEHVPFGHLLDVQTSKLVSRQDGNSLSAFNSHKPQMSARCVGSKLSWDSVQTLWVNIWLQLCCNTLANFIFLFLFILLSYNMSRPQLPLPLILQDPIPTSPLSRFTPLPSGVIFLGLHIVIIFIENDILCLEHVFLTLMPYCLRHNIEQVFPKKMQNGRSINKEYSIIIKNTFWMIILEGLSWFLWRRQPCH